MDSTHRSRYFGIALAAHLVGLAGCSGPSRQVSLSPSAQPQSPQNAEVASAPSGLWESATTGKEYRVKMESDVLTAEWANVPAASAQHGVFIRTECRRAGPKWTGTSKMALPCAIGNGPIINQCNLTMRIEIDKITADEISGRVEDPRRDKFDCKTCKVGETEWKDFVWIPKR